VIALLTIPAATVGRFTSRMATMMVGAVILCAAITTTGLGLSYHLDLPTGAVDVVLASAIYLLALLLDRPALRQRLRGGS
jgi:zinc transport system permease protein